MGAKDKLPTVSDYADFLYRICKKQNITLDVAHTKYGQFTYKQWDELFNVKPEQLTPQKVNELWKQMYGESLPAQYKGFWKALTKEYGNK